MSPACRWFPGHPHTFTSLGLVPAPKLPLPSPPKNKSLVLLKQLFIQSVRVFLIDKRPQSTASRQGAVAEGTLLTLTPAWAEAQLVH